MNEEPLDPSGGASRSPAPPVLLRPRREVFEYGLLPIPKLIFTDGTSTLETLKKKLLERAVSRQQTRIDARGVAEVLDISIDHALLILDTLASVLPSDPDPHAPEGTADVYDLVIFLYIQSYKRLLPKGHKDSTSVGDVWPHSSPFDRYLSVLSPLQLVRSNSRRSVPSQTDEEAHQLSYLQKHLPNILDLLAEPVAGDDDESLVLTHERFEHLGFLIQFGEKKFGVPLTQAAHFFANSDPDMPNAPAPAAQILEWILQNVAASLEDTAERMTTKEDIPLSGSDMDAFIPDASITQVRVESNISRNVTYSRSQTFVEGISKASVIKRPSDIKGNSVKVINCHDSVIYLLAPVGYATIYGCSDTTIVLGAIGKVVKVEHCERVQVITAAKRICIATCRECLFFLGVTQRPLILGDNHNLKVAPYNTFYPQLNEHMAQVGLNAAINRWNEPLALGMVDPHDSLSHPAGVSDVPAESATCLDPDQFTNFLIPDGSGGDSAQLTNDNPFRLPEAYMASQKKRHLASHDILQAMRNAQLEEKRKRELASALHIHFKDWLYASGNIRQLYCLQGD
ncbi:unnamed protein product [Spirodela intermedia]|uniref:TBCC domain-containing protein 1 n=1 Tax=Spirodela intermedia TaxID=51605 RepID=A0A7I8LJL2_SPIIN|nr:unnamed protein product [Spirodela intermedia]